MIIQLFYMCKWSVLEDIIIIKQGREKSETDKI